MPGWYVNPATTFRFGACELDEAGRTLRVHGRELRLQPRVFDLLCYLVRHRERVVPKDELLDALWPGTVVVDNALQRVVSLARGALAEAGLPEAVRTYARHGYRFCLEQCADEAGAGTDTPLAAAQAAAAQSDWDAACAAYAAADAAAALAPADVEAWAQAAICGGRGPEVVPALERTVAAQDAAGDALGAARATLLLVQIRTDQTQGVLARGLLQRAARFLAGRAVGAEHGHHAWMSSRLALGGGDAEGALALADEACRIARALRDTDLECLGLVYRGHSMLVLGRVDDALAQHEEAAAVIRLGGVRAWVAGWALCSVLYAARYRCDWLRAAQFADAFEEWGRTSRMPAFPGTCQLHRAAVLGMQGEHERALAEAHSAATLLARAAPWAEGDAYCVLGDIQLCVGDFDGAEAAYRQAHALGWDPQPGLARLHLLTGRAALALRGLERALGEPTWTLRSRRGLLLCLLAQAAVALGDSERARAALAEVAAAPQWIGAEALQALHADAQAALALHDGDRTRALHLLHQALRHWRAAGCRAGEFETRLQLVDSLLNERDPAAAELELHALAANPLAGAAPHRARLAALRAALEGA